MKVLKFILLYLKDWRNWLSHSIVGILILLVAFYLPVNMYWRILFLIIVISINILRMQHSKKNKK